MIGFVVNPVSGNGRGEKVWRVVEASLLQKQIPFQVKKTARQGEGRKETVELLRDGNVDLVVAVGGDGTINEVINGIYEANASCRFAHIAAGSGNDFARRHCLPTDPLRALEKILTAKEEQNVDLLRINGTIGMNAIGVGFDGTVAKTANEASYKKWFNQWKLGVLSYVLSVIRVLFFYQPCSVTLTVDGKEESIQNVWLIAVANIPNYGGGMLICPNADDGDGLADICVVSNISRWGLLRAFPLIFSGAHVKHPAVRFLHGKKIEIRSARPLIVHADGEIVSETPVTIEVLHGHQRVLV